MTDDLQRIVRIRPAYDCLMVQPCVHGSKACGVVPDAGHGRHGAEMHIVLRGPVAEIILVVQTGWYLPETPKSVRMSAEVPRPAFIEFHSGVPRFEGHQPQRSSCELWTPCYGDVGYSMADEPTELLVRKGSDAVWEWLEAAYRTDFAEAVS